jgi:hypothetical protein
MSSLTADTCELSSTPEAQYTSSQERTPKDKLQIDTSTSISVDTICGSIRSVGRANVNLTFCHITDSVYLHVFDTFQSDLLIGLRDIAKFDVQVDFTTRTLKQKAVNPVVEEALRPERHIITQLNR